MSSGRRPIDPNAKTSALNEGPRDLESEQGTAGHVGHSIELPTPDTSTLARETERAAIRAQLFGHQAAPTIGRYSVLKVLGEGGMGTVYSAFDDRLDRRVALKLIKRAAARGARERMLREAQALARLSHPNVVPVFEVGEDRGQLFLAMEYVKGETLRDWQDARDHNWHRILDKYIQAGHGLAAAHAQGLVHRDFKPGNAVVGNDGRVRVLDFGLARKQVDTDLSRGTATVIPAPKTNALESPLTATGTVMGTPAYMPPEQYVGGDVDHRSDQFSFCVALWEALYGARPFEANNVAQLFTRIAGGVIAEPGPSDVPGKVRRALEKGLQPNPEDRWPTLHLLLTELSPRYGGPAAISPWIVYAMGVLVLVTGALLFGLFAPEDTDSQLGQAPPRVTNALLVAVARSATDPEQVAAMLREVRTSDPQGVYGWAPAVEALWPALRRLGLDDSQQLGAARDERTVLWTVPFCAAPQTRVEALGETAALAEIRHQRCIDLVSTCSREPYQQCHQRVQREFATDP